MTYVALISRNTIKPLTRCSLLLQTGEYITIFLNNEKVMHICSCERDDMRTIGYGPSRAKIEGNEENNALRLWWQFCHNMHIKWGYFCELPLVVSLGRQICTTINPNNGGRKLIIGNHFFWLLGGKPRSKCRMQKKSS
jgi:hypothetical protein